MTTPFTEIELQKRIETCLSWLPQLRALMLEGYSQTPGSRGLAHLKTQNKSSFSDLVTIYDPVVEKWLCEKLQTHFPNEAIIGEESTSEGKIDLRSFTKDKELFWVIDPIDGTTNFSRSYPFFCSTWSLLLRKENSELESVLALTYDPTRDEAFYAVKGQGAWLNRQQIKCSPVQDPREALLTTGFASLRQKTCGKEEVFSLFETLTQETLGVRRDGAAALDMAYVACGRIDAYWEQGLSIWDIAAGTLLIKEAGGRVTRRDGDQVDLFDGEIVSGNDFLHKWLLNKIKGAQ